MVDSEQIAQFIELTGASTAEAHQFLQGSDLQTAVATYFAAQDEEHVAKREEASDDDIEMTGATQGGIFAPSPAATRPATTSGTGYTLSGAPIPASTEQVSRPSSTGGSNSGPRIGRIGGSSTGGRGNASSSSGGARIGTLSSLNANDSGDDSEDDDDEARRRKAEFYAGGGRSGLAIQGPDDGKQGMTGEDLVKEILARAKEGGQRGEDALSAGKGKASSGRGAFAGAGMTLGSDEVASVAVPDPAAALQPRAPQPAQHSGGLSGYMAQLLGGAGPGNIPGMSNPVHDEDAEEEEVQVRHLTFWRDGFSVEDGPLMKYDDPANQEILTAIKAGRAPLSILNVKFGAPVELRVAQRQTEAYQPPPKKPAKPFSGAGNRLGSPAPDLVSHASGASTTMPGGFESTPAPPTSVPPVGSVGLEVNESKPTTSVQVRLADGTKMVAKLNLDHTVGDIRRFIAAAQPGSRPYVIQTTFPNKTLDDDSLTVEQAGLKNAVVVQRWT